MSRFLSGILAGVFTFFVLSNGGKIEGMVSPVVVGAHIVGAQYVNATTTRVRVYAQKRRECSFDSVSWESEAGVRADITFEEGLRERSMGLLELGPWLLQMSKVQLETSEAWVFHRCHPFWLTRTRFIG